MPLDKNVTEQLIEKYRVTPNDTGSSEVQISLLTSRITNLTDHLRNNNHDQSSKRGLLKLVGTRRKLLKYLRSTTKDRYITLINDLGLRK
jgi:small subunit ribosomal protein S15